MTQASKRITFAHPFRLGEDFISVVFAQAGRGVQVDRFPLNLGELLLNGKKAKSRSLPRFEFDRTSTPLVGRKSVRITDYPRPVF
jgi:hypothetical protein